jgi:transcriptional regulator with XRE-family HTH domain
MENNFRKNLRDELIYQDITVKELSAKSGIAKGALDCYVGKQASMPPATTAVKIARALGVSVEYLVSGQQEQREEIVILSNPRLRYILALLEDLDEKGQDIMAGIAQVLKRHRLTTEQWEDIDDYRRP